MGLTSLIVAALGYCSMSVAGELPTRLALESADKQPSVTNCLQGNAEDWQKVLDYQTAWEVANVDRLDEAEKERNPSLSSGDIYDWLKYPACVKHQPYQKPLPAEVEACLERWNSRSEITRANDGDREADPAYFRWAAARSLPKFPPQSVIDNRIALPPGLRQAWPDPKKFLAELKRLRLPYIVYDSPIVKPDDDSTRYTRIQFRYYDPKGAYRVLYAINLSAPAPKNGNTPQPKVSAVMGAIYIQDKDNHGEKLSAPSVSPTDMIFSQTGQPPAIQHNSETCVGCHIAAIKKTEILPGSLQALGFAQADAEPRVAPADDPAWKLYESFNKEALMTTQATAHGGTLPPYGPRWGEGKSCTSCHDAMRIHSADAASSITVIAKKMLDELRMPPPEYDSDPEIRKRGKALLDRLDQGVKLESLGPDDQKLYARMKARNEALFLQLRRQFAKDVQVWERGVPCAKSPPKSADTSLDAYHRALSGVVTESSEPPEQRPPPPAASTGGVPATQAPGGTAPTTLSTELQKQ